MRCRPQAITPVWIAAAVAISGAAPVLAGDPQMDRLHQSPVAGDWITNGGNLTSQ